MVTKKKTTSTKRKSSKSVKKSVNVRKHTHDDNMIGMLAHLTGLLFGLLGPLVIYILKKDEKGLSRENARHALNFQISIIIYMVASIILMVVIVGFFTFVGIWILSIITQIMGSIKAYEGQIYEYPLEIEFIK